MPKGFTNEEKRIIRNKLIEKGIELFEIYGVKKTNVEELTNSVGISKGSFYLFYNSKEELFFDVLKKTEKKLIKEMRLIIKDMKSNPREVFKKFLRFHIKSPTENPIIQQIADKNIREYIIRKTRNVPKLEKYLQTYDYLPLFIKMWQKDGIIINKDPELLAGILKAIFTIGLDDSIKEYIGRDRLPEVIENLIEIITDYMINFD